MSTLTKLSPVGMLGRGMERVPVIVVSANPGLRHELIRRLGAKRWALTEAESGADALARLDLEGGELLLLDPALPDLEPSEFHALVSAHFPKIHVVTVNSHTGQPLLRSSSPSAVALRAVEDLERSGGLQGLPVEATVPHPSLFF